MSKEPLTKQCSHCGETFEKPYSCGLPEWFGNKKRPKGTRFCKKSCADIFKKGISLKHPKQFPKGHIPANKGKKDPVSAKRMRENNPMRNLDVKKKSSDSHRGKNMGVNHHNWKGGVSRESDKIRHSIEGNLWRQSVFARDNFTDQKSGIRGGNLHAHHILNFSSNPTLRFAIDNGITLSEKSHNEFHKKYGKENNTPEQLEMFLTSK